MLLASVVIATKNRREVLLEALRTTIAQSGDIEVIVMDDGSTDGTAEAVREHFPSVAIHRSEESRGSVLQRNAGVAAARSNNVVLIDDDCTFEHPETIRQAVDDLGDPRVGAVAIPFVNIERDPKVRQAAPSGDRVFVASAFVGCSAVVRRDLFLRLGGYWPALNYYFEEPDFCFRLLGAGYVTRLGRSNPVTHHYTDVARRLRRVRFLAARNPCMFAWHNVPWPYFPLHLAAVSMREARSYLRYGYLGATVTGVFYGWRDGIHHYRERRPSSIACYRLFREIKAKEPVAIEEIRMALESLGTSPAA